ncbi:MAG: alpha-ketoacid dehydrogenase subunit beta [Alphaproteobacteria bacterium]|jgi:pyruvate/2-oxoglutarate/acetoin dehydrogenase E1 component|nr:alpha-ketoacid dehydrogenase subunit beta [Alphaproteobacteria bacterium]|tara:strand:+ start:393 stop:1376 length:984 start_codon:yes stop_codon:yes gene_type:complete
MTEMTFADAVREGLAEELRRDPLVWALGEDLSTAHGGTSANQYVGLIDEFGPKRIVNTPISENTIMGAAVGAAVAGTRPVADLRMADFGMCAVDELVNQAAKIRYMFGGQARVPLVVRQAIGVRKGAAAQHSQSTEAWYVHTPGLVVVAPGTPADGRGLLKSAIRADDPVVYMEHKDLWLASGDVPDDEGVVPIGVAKTVREGSDLTIVSWSKMARLCEEVADTLAGDGVSVDVIDLRTLWPWDKDAVYASVCKTGRLLVAQEAVQVGGFAAEIATDVTENCFDALKTHARRIGAPRMPVPYAEPMENEFRVTPERIIARARELLAA